MIHIGKEIRAIVKKKNVNITDLAVKINKSRPVVYNIFERDSIDTSLLLKLSKVLEHDFFQLYENQTLIEEPVEKYKIQNKRIKELEMQLQEKETQLKAAQKEIEYLKKINSLLEEKNRNL